MLSIKQILKSQRGDTIVEVLMCLAVLGVAGGGAFLSTNQNIKITQASQERLAAVKLAESQVELLRIAVRENTSLYNPGGSFCLPLSSPCTMSADGNAAAAGVQPRYNVGINKVSDINSTPGVTGVRYQISVVWESIRGSGNDRLDTYYEVYR